MVEHILSQGYGYGFAVGVGAGFAILMVIISTLLSKYMGQVQTSERFSTASRNVSSGLIASSTVSAWTWPATLLLSGTWSYIYGISGAWLYAVGGTIQITLFAFLALQIKRRAPTAHTVSETVYIRFGKAGHLVYLCYCAATNVMVSSLLLLGGSQAFAATTGMHTVAASFLLPLTVVIYTALGGLKATFISDWVHTVIIYVILIVTAYTVYCSSPLIGSPGRMWDLLKEAQEIFPNTSGTSYLSFKDKNMVLLTWSVMLGGLSSVFGDPGYSQRAIASDSKSVFMGYMMGALCWMIIPFALGSSAGLACRALLTNPASVTFPNPLSEDEVGASLPFIYGLAAIFGKSGAAAGLVMLEMSVTSATSAELIAFSSITTYDLYRTYFNPGASGQKLVRASHISVVCFGLFMAALAVVFNYINVTVSWLLSFLGIVLNPEVFAVTLALFWPKMTKLSLLIGVPLGTVSGVVCWIGATYHYAGGTINRATLMTTEATFIGNIVSLFSSAIYIVAISLIKPEGSFNLDSFKWEVRVADDIDTEEQEALVLSEKDEKLLNAQTWLSLFINLFLLLGVYVVLTCALYGWGGDLSRGSFTAFMIVMLIWLVLAALYIILTPLWQGRRAIKTVTLRLCGRKPELSDRPSVQNSTDSNPTLFKTSPDQEKVRELSDES
ncbi:LANO_0F00320g1_1 [Lachancea nothofagi CBS 11611]|uniref:LANO_0F00320g1_1 n=1 Tax=Lachancea nothofagi CBS 11611 TaxID=1266666 RepID=A0A1G4K5G5_9SACH|nr:LANO_0F00320g1_1 [Lachancea nothofagi CBS 11611]